jgi:hypothetical protein
MMRQNNTKRPETGAVGANFIVLKEKNIVNCKEKLLNFIWG